MSDKIITVNETTLKNELKDNIKKTIQETLNELLDAETNELVRRFRHGVNWGKLISDVAIQNVELSN